MDEMPPVTRHVYREHIQRFGEPDLASMYDESTARAGAPLALNNVLVMCWRPTPELDMTTFTTIGMSARHQPKSSILLELHFSVRQRLAEDAQRATTQFLANMANYPWDHGIDLDWWHILRNPGPIPAFPHCSSILLHPRFTPDGWDHVHCAPEVIHLLNLVPITEEERVLAASSREALLTQWETDKTDIFADR